MQIYQRSSLKVREGRWFKIQRLRMVKFVHCLLTMMTVSMLALLINGPVFAQQTFGIAGYMPNGSLDSTFDGDGKVIADLPNGASGSATAVAIDASNRIVVAGTVDHQFALARYYVDGSLDSTFGNGGHVLTSLGSLAEAKAIAIDKNGRIVVAGKANGKFTLACYNSDGSLDTTFSDDGKAQTSDGPDHQAEAVDQDHDRRHDPIEDAAPSLSASASDVSRQSRGVPMSRNDAVET